MAEIIQRDGTWAFDGESVRIVPGRDKGVNLARQSLGELTVPLEALAGISYEPGRKAGRLRLRLRDGSDPLLQATGGKLPDAANPYQLTVQQDRSGVAEYFVDEVRNALLLEQVPGGPCDRYLLPGPSVPLSASAGDGTASFDGERIHLEWNWKTEESKRSSGACSFSVADVHAVEWLPAAGLEDGYLRFVMGRHAAKIPPKYDPYAIELYGFRKDMLMTLVAAAVTARMPHPAAPPEQAATALPSGDGERAGGTEDHDALLRRLRELGELRQSGVLTEDEFTAAKQAVLRRF
ncbi:DUF4429 domain-containing protein [Streptomyces sp. SAJ15]|uniref:DUF4429 domain-containing protein n=1 Tax=Streptomyces sp. SAJ15 TaxID=2011095 RepID=UPI001185F24E|nr:DUF4429 domain-containing protein [Streptomyces sp. SAJ15]TVL92044.1 Tat pathway signal sequence domain protein [Streptomyces sp. SAJ15]